MYAQRKTVSSSAVAALLEGVRRHGTDMRVEQQYVATHGPSAVAFALCHLLNCQLLPRLQGIHRQQLYRPTTGQPDAYPHLQAMLTRPRRGDLSRQQYDQMIK
jgi:TnpA family transposase